LWPESTTRGPISLMPCLGGRGGERSCARLDNSHRFSAITFLTWSNSSFSIPLSNPHRHNEDRYNSYSCHLHSCNYFVQFGTGKGSKIIKDQQGANCCESCQRKIHQVSDSSCESQVHQVSESSQSQVNQVSDSCSNGYSHCKPNPVLLP